MVDSTCFLLKKTKYPQKRIKIYNNNDTVWLQVIFRYVRSFSVKNIYAGKKKKRNYLFCTRYNSILNPERKILIIKVGLAATAKWYYKLYCQWLFRLSFFLELNLVVLTRRICHTTMLSLGVAWRKTVSDKKCRNKRDLPSKGLAPLSSPRKKFLFLFTF